MTEDNLNVLNNELQVEPEIQNHLLATASWAKVTAVTGFIISFFIVILTYQFVQQATRPHFFSSSRGLSTQQQMIVVFYILIAIIHAVLSFLQFRFASNIQLAVRDSDQFAFTQFFQTLKIFAIIRGIVAVLTGILLILAVIGISKN